MLRFVFLTDKEQFKALASEISDKRVCMYTGAELWGYYVYSGVYGQYGLVRAGMEHLAVKGEQELEGKLKAFEKTLMSDCESLTNYLNAVNISVERKEKVANLVNCFPFFRTTPDSERDVENFFSDFKYEIGVETDKTKKEMLSSVYDFVVMLDEIAADYLYCRENYRKDEELINPEGTTSKIPRRGMLFSLLHAFLPCTERAKALGAIMRGMPPFFAGEALISDKEGKAVNYVLRSGKVVPGFVLMSENN